MLYPVTQVILAETFVAVDERAPDLEPSARSPMTTTPATSTHANAPMIAKRRFLRVERVEVGGMSDPMPVSVGVSVIGCLSVSVHGWFYERTGWDDRFPTT